MVAPLNEFPLLTTQQRTSAYGHVPEQTHTSSDSVTIDTCWLALDAHIAQPPLLRILQDAGYQIITERGGRVVVMDRPGDFDNYNKKETKK
jgi:hypothetical protein